MMRLVALLFLSLALSGCGGGRQALGKASGKYRVLNAGKWTPTRADLRGPRAPRPPVQAPVSAQPNSQGGGA